MSFSSRLTPSPWLAALLLSFAVSLAAAMPSARAEEDVTPRPPEVEGGKDHPKIPRYPDAVLEQYSHKEFEEYDLATKFAGDDFVKQKVSGEYWAMLYDNPRKTGVTQVTHNYENALSKAGFDIVMKHGIPDDRYLTAIHPKGGKIWFYMHAFKSNDTVKSEIVIVEGKALEQKIEIDVGALEAAFKKDGRVAIHGITFETNSAKLREESEKVLAAVLRVVDGDKAVRVRIEGHTDSVGGAKQNLVLSKKRASAVRGWLVTKGVDEDRLEVEGLGETKPIADNKTDEGRAQNRRVELVRLDAKK